MKNVTRRIRRKLVAPANSEDKSRWRYATTRHAINESGIPTIFLPPDGKDWDTDEVKISDDGTWVVILWRKHIEEP